MNRIKQLREELGISQAKLGEKLNKTQQQISLYENGTNELDLDGYIILSNLFSCSIEYIAGKSDIRNPEKIDSDKINIGLSIKDYVPPTKEQQKKIEEFARFVLQENKKDTKDKKEG